MSCDEDLPEKQARIETPEQYAHDDMPEDEEDQQTYFSSSSKQAIMALIPPPPPPVVRTDKRTPPWRLGATMVTIDEPPQKKKKAPEPREEAAIADIPAGIPAYIPVNIPAIADIPGDIPADIPGDSEWSGWTLPVGSNSWWDKEFLRDFRMHPSFNRLLPFPSAYLGKNCGKKGLLYSCHKLLGQPKYDRENDMHMLELGKRNMKARFQMMLDVGAITTQDLGPKALHQLGYRWSANAGDWVKSVDAFTQTA